MMIGVRRRAGNGVRPVDPAAEIDESTPIGAKRERGQVVDPVDGEGLRADRATSLDHQLVPPEPAEDGGGDDAFAESPPEEELLDDPLVVSALAAFLYESLR